MIGIFSSSSENNKMICIFKLQQINLVTVAHRTNLLYISIAKLLKFLVWARIGLGKSQSKPIQIYAWTNTVSGSESLNITAKIG
jgi:hypothetical protein